MKNLLSQYHEGDSVTISRIIAGGRIRNRLMELGFRRGAQLFIVRYAPLKDPLEVVVAGCNVSLRVEEAELIEVEPADPSTPPAEESECRGDLT
jgi:Fe2+ transport system protein FeoA